MTKDNYDAIVIGAGHNGLVTAGYLAQAGLSVLVLERLDKLGGAVTTDEYAPGFQGPMCSYVSYIMQGKVVDDLKLREHGFEMIRRPNGGFHNIHPFLDGTFLDGPGIDSEFDLATQIAGFSEKDSRSYFQWRSFWDDASAIFAPYFLTDPPTIADLMSDVRGTRQEEVLEKLLTWSYMDAVTDAFEDERVQGNFMAIMESNPSAPGSMLGPAIEHAGMAASRPADKGIPRMSMGSIAGSLESSVTEPGRRHQDASARRSGDGGRRRGHGRAAGERRDDHCKHGDLQRRPEAHVQHHARRRGAFGGNGQEVQRLEDEGRLREVPGGYDGGARPVTLPRGGTTTGTRSRP